jgi:hypothetical protein
MPNWLKTRFMVPEGNRHSLVSISATPGQKKKAYAHVFPANVTKLDGAIRHASLSTTKAI